MSTDKPRSSPPIQVWSPSKTRNPNVKDIKFNEFSSDDNGNITADHGYIFFRNGHGAHITRHYRDINGIKSLTHYSAIILQILPRGGVAYLRVNAEGDKHITDDNRYHIGIHKVPNPNMFTDKAKHILPINLFLRQVQTRKPHKRSPARNQFVNAAEHNLIQRGLPKSLKTQQFKLDI